MIYASLIVTRSKFIITRQIIHNVVWAETVRSE